MNLKCRSSPHWSHLLSRSSAMWSPCYVSAHPQWRACARDLRISSAFESSGGARTPWRYHHGNLGAGARNWRVSWESDSGHLPWHKVQVPWLQVKHSGQRGTAGDHPSDYWVQRWGQRRVHCDHHRSQRGQDQYPVHRQDLWYSVGTFDQLAM